MTKYWCSQEEVMDGTDQTTEYARRLLTEIEGGRHHCQQGQYGRKYQVRSFAI